MKGIVEREKSVINVLAARRRWARSTAATLADLLGPELAEGERLPDLELLQELFGRALERRWRRVAAAHEACVGIEDRRRELHVALDAAVRPLYREVVDLRARLKAIFGAAAASRLIGLRGETCRDPLALLRQGDRAAARLRDPARPLPPASCEPTEHDRMLWRAPVETAAGTLRSAVARESLAGKELEAAQAELRRALADFNAFFVRVAGWFEGSYRAAGRDDRAEVVRPSRRRKGLLLEQVSRAGARADLQGPEGLTTALASRI